MFLLVPAHPGSPGQTAVKRLLLLLLSVEIDCRRVCWLATELIGTDLMIVS